MAYNTYIFGGPLTLGYSYSELWVDEHNTGFMSLTLPHWASSWGITFSGFRGLFYISPVLLLALFLGVLTGSVVYLAQSLMGGAGSVVDANITRTTEAYAGTRAGTTPGGWPACN